MKTWHFEMAVAAVLLGGTASIRGSWIDWVGALAVLLSFGHMCVAERMRERQVAAHTPVEVTSGYAFSHGQVVEFPAHKIKLEMANARQTYVECHRMLNLYLVGKEAAWVVFFVATESFPALLGCALFLLYPVWRKLYRRRRPLGAL